MFGESETLTHIFYGGAMDQLATVSIGSGNDALYPKIYFYSSSTPSVPGNHWHYVDDVPTVW